jgi:fructose-specific phosphotransferase system IIC component
MSFMTVFVLIAALFAGISLFNGVVSMAHGGAADQESSHWLMLKRVGWQGLALLFIVLALLSNLQ